MKRLALGLLLAASCLAVSALSVPKIGSIDYIEGSVSISRSGKVFSAPEIGDDLFSGDLIKTQADGKLVVALDKNTGMGGTLTIKSRSALYLNLDELKGQPRTNIQLLTGAIGSKVNKLAGSPTVEVTTSSAVMAVRGTEYEVAVSVNADDSGGSQQAVVVVCTQSKVAVDDGQGEVEVGEGKVLEKRPGMRVRFIPVAVSSAKGYSEKWIADEIVAFRADAPRALASYAKRYADLSAKFEAAYAPFRDSPLPKKWAEEDRAGTKVNPLEPEVLREKKEMVGYLLNIKKVLTSFERVYYRIDELSDLVMGTPDEKSAIGPGVTAGGFLASCFSEREKLIGEVARYRYIEDLYKARSPDGGAFDDDDDFFASSDDF
jgi:hypothetical protein